MSYNHVLTLNRVCNLFISTILKWWHVFTIRSITFKRNVSIVFNNHYFFILILRSIVPKLLTLETFKIPCMFRLSIRFTFGTYKDINLSFGWFDFGATEGFWLRNPLSWNLASMMMKNPNCKLIVHSLSFKVVSPLL